MTKILLSCNTDTVDIASNLRADIEEQLGFKVALDVEDAEDPSENDEVTEAAVLLVFQFGDESLSAWVMIEDADKRTGGITYEESAFPEIINFDKGVARGIRILRYIMVNEFGLVVRSIDEKKETKTSQHSQVEQSSKLSPPKPLGNNNMYNIDQLLKDQKQYEAEKQAKKHKGMLGKIGKIFGKSGRRLSQ